jgi:vacuolar-type H+-ATPase subunit H
MTLSNETIETMLTQLKENQEDLKKDYNSRIDKLENKIEIMFDKIEKKYDEYVTKAEFKYQEERIKTLEEDRKKLVWIVISTVVIAILSLVIPNT